MKEFLEDLNRIKYIKKLFTRYLESGELKERLILNHVIVLNNLFGPIHSTRILFFKIDSQYWPLLKPFLVMLDILPAVIYNIDKRDNNIVTDEIPMNMNVVQALRKI